MHALRRSAALVLAATLPLAAACAPAARSATAQARASQAPTAPALATAAGIAAAQRFARTRAGTVGFAVLEEGGRPRGLNRTVRFPSASVSKAMLMVAALRRAAARRLSPRDDALLRAMVTASDNDAADRVYRSLGGAAVTAVARAAGSRRFAEMGHWSNEQLTPADQARLFLRIDELVPPPHRAYARLLLSSIVGPQRWGIAPVAHRRGLQIFFKGGWRRGVVHQVALLEAHGRRLALAILTSGQPSHDYGRATLRGIAVRVLG